MIRHVVMWKISEQQLPAGETAIEAAERLSRALNRLFGVVPGIVTINAGANCVAQPGNWDFGLVADFEHQEDLDAYQDHPAHQEVVAQIRAVVNERACVDFEM